MVPRSHQSYHESDLTHLRIRGFEQQANYHKNPLEGDLLRLLVDMYESLM